MMEASSFYIFGAIALLAAVNMVVQKKIFYSAVSFIICLCAIAALYLTLDAPFIAAVQVIVYAGAVMVLFLFVIMLLDPYSKTVLQDKRKYLVSAGIVLGVFILALSIPLLHSYDPDRTPRTAQVISGGIGSARHIGNVLFSEYLLPFEMTSVLILAAIIGVVVLSKRRL